MAEFTALSALLNHGFDTVIDVRSPAEFAEDHLPGAINLPALSNDQRAEVGTIHKQVSPFKARKIGAALVARNVADHLTGPLAEKPGAWRPLVYCWRGGQRSGSFASILTQIGWRAETIKGGYMTYRRLVFGMLYDTPMPHRIVLLDGNTGTAKTDILQRLSARDLQVLDLEGMAGHRGSLLGATAAGQPAQKGFESQLAAAITALDPDKITVVEAESSKIGQINLPKQIWAAMTTAPRLVIDAPLQARAAYLTQAYSDVISDPAELKKRLNPLRNLRSHAVVDGWISLLDQGDMEGLATALMRDHYDPAYTRSRRIDSRAMLGEVAVETLDPIGQDKAADDIAKRLKQL